MTHKHDLVARSIQPDPNGIQPIPVPALPVPEGTRPPPNSPAMSSLRMQEQHHRTGSFAKDRQFGTLTRRGLIGFRRELELSGALD